MTKLLGSSLEGLLEDAASLCQLLLADVERRDEPQHVEHRRAQQQHVALQAFGDDLWCDLLDLLRARRGCCCVLRRGGGGSVGKLNTDHETSSTDVFDQVAVFRVLLEAVEEGYELVGTLGDVVEYFLLFEDLDDGGRGCAGDCVTCVGAAHRAWLLKAHELVGRCDTGEGETVGDTLGEDEDVGTNARLFDGKHGSSTAETGLDLVADEKEVVLVANLAEAVKEGGGSRDVSTLTDDRLDQDRRSVRGSSLLLQCQAHLVERLTNELFDVGVDGQAEVRVEGERGGKDTGHERTVAFTVDGLGASESSSGGSSTVVRSLHNNDVLLLGSSTSELDSSLDSFGTGVPEKDGVKGRVGKDREEVLDELDLSCREADVDLSYTKRRGSSRPCQFSGAVLADAIALEMDLPVHE